MTEMMVKGICSLTSLIGAVERCRVFFHIFLHDRLYLAILVNRMYGGTLSHLFFSLDIFKLDKFRYILILAGDTAIPRR